MPRPKVSDSKIRAEEKRQKKNEKIGEKARIRGRLQSRPNKDRIKVALTKFTVGGEAPCYTELRKAAGLPNDTTFRNNLKEMVETKEVIKVKIDPDKKKYVYILNKMRPDDSLIFFAICTLHDRLTKGYPITDFNQLLGSFITYTLKNYEWEHANHIITLVLTQIEDYTKQPPPARDQRLLLCGVPAVSYDVESPEWVMWRSVDSRKYVLTEKILEYVRDTKSKKSPKKNQDAQLPCNGQCICNDVTDGCFNKLIEAKSKAKRTNNNMSWRDQVIERESFDYPRFEKEWITKTK